MALPANLVKISWNFELDGGIDNGGDIAQPSAWYWSQLGLPSDPQDALEQTAEDAYGSWSSSFSDGNFPTSLELVSVRATLYDASVHAALVAEYAPTTTWKGTGTASMPWQLTCCVGLYSYQPGTYVPQNRRKRGRIFLPPMALNQLQNGPRGVLGSSAVTAALDSTVACLVGPRDTQVWGTSGTNGLTGPIVASKVAGQTYEVLYATADQVLDTQRRRTNSETRTKTVVAMAS